MCWGTFLNFFAFFVYTLLMTRYMHAASGLVSSSMELLTCACQFEPKFVDLSVRFIRILFDS